MQVWVDSVSYEFKKLQQEVSERLKKRGASHLCKHLVTKKSRKQPHIFSKREELIDQQDKERIQALFECPLEPDWSPGDAMTIKPMKSEDGRLITTEALVTIELGSLKSQRPKGPAQFMAHCWQYWLTIGCQW